jgi:hypothetical protein
MQTPTALVPGPAREALSIAIHALELADTAPAALKSKALSDVAHCYRALGALAPAESYLQQALRWSRLVGAADAAVDLLCELSELAVEQASAVAEDDERSAHRCREAARDFAFDAAQLACKAADAHWEVQVLLRVSEALDRCGDHGDAIALQCRALNLLFQNERVLDDYPRTDAHPVM